MLLLLNSIDYKSLRKVEWDLKRVSNCIQIINDYGVENNMIWHSGHTSCYNI
jgi:hypothetical protein